jgi:PAS domain S-box-containing protein
VIIRWAVLYVTDVRGLPSDFSFLGSGGEMAGRVAELDWAGTLLGRFEDWPGSLRTAVGICLSSRHPMVIWWGQDLVLLYNDAWVPILGPSKHPALGRPGESVWPEMWHIIGEQLRSVLATGEATWSDDQLLPARRFGYLEEAYFTYSYSAIRDESGGVGGVFTAVTETTSRVLGERRLGTLRELGEVPTAQTRSVEEACEAVAAVLARHRADTPFAAIYLNDGEDRPLRYAAGQGFVIVPPALVDRNADWWSLAAAVDSGETQVTDDVGETCAGMVAPGWGPLADTAPDTVVALPFTASGSARAAGVVLVGVSPHRALDEDYLSFLSLVAGHVSTVVSDARAYDEERRRAEALAELDRAKTEFFANLSHEFRTPLTLILGPAEDSLADEASPLPPAHRERVEIIRRNAERLRRMVNDMLDFSRIDAGRMQPVLVATDLGEFTRGIVASFAPAVRRAGLELVVDCPDVGVVALDQDMWEKVVLNLLSNAVKFTLDGRIEVALRGTGDEVELRVSDTGVGIPDFEVGRLFQRFHRVRSTTGRSHEGSGIGLALVHQLVALHAGVVSVTSELGRGSSFLVRLPRAALPDAPGPAAPTTGRRPGAADAYLSEASRWRGVGQDTDTPADVAPAERPAAPSATVLVVDDNADLRLMLERVLSPHWRVRVAVDGREALAAVAAEQPDLVLTDVMMPDLDGFALLDALRRDPGTANIPVIMLSARAGEGAAVDGLGAGADDYLVKPFSSQELRARVRSNLELARARNQESAWRSALVAAIQDGVFVADTEGTVVEVNSAFAALTGFGPDGLPYARPHPWWPPAGPHHEWLGAAVESAARGEPVRGEAPFRRRDGGEVWVSLSVNGIDHPRTGQRMLVGTVKDVTAEQRSVDRARPLSRLTARLAQASDVHEVLSVGMAELREVWRARQVVVADQREHGPVEVLADPPLSDPSWDALPGDLRDLLVRVRRAGTTALASGDGLVSGIGARAGDTTTVWITLETPRPLSGDERALFGVLCDYLGLAVRRAQLFDEQQEVATVLQRAILGPVELPDGVAARYLPAIRPLTVGGDWYDVFPIEGGLLGLVVGDCVGRGLPAASVMGQLRSAVRALMLQGKPPGEVLELLDTFVLGVPGARSTTVVCGLLDTRTGMLRYSTAGHPLPPWSPRKAG